MFTKIKQKIEASLRSIIAEEVSKIVALEVAVLRVFVERQHNEITPSLRRLGDLHFESLRLLNLMEQSQPTCCAEKQKLLIEMRDSTQAFMDSVKRLHPSL